MNFSVKKTIFSREKPMRVEKIVTIANEILITNNYTFRCDGCNVALKNALPWACVWAVRLSDNVGGGYRLCNKCTDDAKIEIAALSVGA